MIAPASGSSAGGFEELVNVKPEGKPMKSSRPSFAVVAAAALVAILLTFNSPIFNSLTAAALTRNALVANALASPALDDLNGLAVEAAALLAGPAR